MSYSDVTDLSEDDIDPRHSTMSRASNVVSTCLLTLLLVKINRVNITSTKRTRHCYQTLAMACDTYIIMQ